MPSHFTHDHLTGVREVAYDPALKTLVSNPIAGKWLTSASHTFLSLCLSTAFAYGVSHVPTNFRVQGSGFRV
eukprot:SAG22_NODE_30_length_28348_cov_12.488584_23_plen_72_part_00